MRLYLLVLLSVSLMACGGNSSSGGAAAASGLASWPASQQGENPPPAPEQFEPIVTNGAELAAMLPSNVVNRLFDPVAFGYTINDISDPVIVEHMVRSTFAQLQDGSRPQHAYHWYGHPYENAEVALIPVEFLNRYGTKLYGEIVLP